MSELLAGETTKKKLSNAELRRTLRCANAEAAGYLARASRAEGEAAQLRQRVLVLEHYVQQALIALQLAHGALSVLVKPSEGH